MADQETRQSQDARLVLVRELEARVARFVDELGTVEAERNVLRCAVEAVLGWTREQRGSVAAGEVLDCLEAVLAAAEIDQAKAKSPQLLELGDDDPIA